MNGKNTENLISPCAADRLISLRDSDMTLLYLYLCRNGPAARDRAPKDLFWPRQRFSEAMERLEMSGLLPLSGEESAPSSPAEHTDVPPKAGTSLPPAPEVPEYTTEDVRNRKESDPAFSTVLSEARLIVGRLLSTPELTRLLGLYEHFELPPEVVMELMHFVAEIYRENYGEGRRPTVGAFEREARIWSERGIRDFDAAERYIQRSRERRSVLGGVKEAMKIVNRDFTETERRYIEQWLDWGFGPEAIALAYDKTVTYKRKFVPGYMHKILQSWHEKGLHTLQEIQSESRRPFGGNSPGGTASGQEPVSPEHLWGIVDEI